MSRAIPLNRSDTVQHVLKALRHDIILYHYPNGQPIKEIELCRRYDCSRTAARNAFIILEKEGLIQARKNGTKEVCCLSFQDIDNIYDLRRHIELSSIKQFFAGDTPDMAPVFQAVNDIRAASETEIAGLLRLDTEFHTAIVKLSQNKALYQAWSNICMVMEEIFTLNMSESDTYKSWFMQTFAERHIDIMSKLLLSEETAISVLSAHIEDAREVSKKAVKKSIEKPL